MKKILFIGILFIFYPLQQSFAQLDEGFYGFSLTYSSGINALQSKEYAEAVKIGRLLIEENPVRPEGYKLVADVHLKESLYGQALFYYSRAYAYRWSFLLQEDELSLYENMATCYIKTDNFSQAVLSLEHVVNWPGKKSTQNIKEIVGRAYFSLALIHRTQNQWVSSRLHFFEAAKNNFKEKLSYLLIAYYYVENEEKTIAENNLAHYKKEIKPEDRLASFNYFYNLYSNAAPDDSYKNDLKKSDYSKVLTAVEKFRELYLQGNVDNFSLDQDAILESPLQP